MTREIAGLYLWLITNLVWTAVSAAAAAQPIHLFVDEGWHLLHYAAIHLATQFGQDLVRSPDAEVIRDAVGIVTLCANTTAGRNFACDRSENGNRTKTTVPAAGRTALPPAPGFATSLSTSMAGERPFGYAQGRPWGRCGSCAGCSGCGSKGSS